MSVSDSFLKRWSLFEINLDSLLSLFCALDCKMNAGCSLSYFNSEILY